MGPHKLTMSMKSKRLFAHKKKKKTQFWLLLCRFYLKVQVKAGREKEKKHFFLLVVASKKEEAWTYMYRGKKVH